VQAKNKRKQNRPMHTTSSKQKKTTKLKKTKEGKGRGQVKGNEAKA